VADEQAVVASSLVVLACVAVNDHRSKNTMCFESKAALELIDDRFIAAAGINGLAQEGVEPGFLDL
jgi:hypothetical protein